ncbi:UDP-N-acetylmuramoyl-L-alanyl-D-glutamate--2,6-diaminopimelate ligase [Candidatus Babeliales bacterium]|nr:UDP-N-acetylmuramoyl-L-alanyl-D-glutamate--2,6-diaminopimelate ligase [Candidatus Babeliales bacterium]
MLVPKNFPVTCHTNNVGPGSTFVAINGKTTNGNTFIEQALEQGATALVVEHPFKACEFLTKHHNTTITISMVPNARKALATMSSNALGNPASQLKIIGVTGTKGKTTTTYLIEHMLRTSGYKTAMLSGVVNKILDREEPSTLTTPESDYLHMFFAECVKQGVDYVVMEVSSHALSLFRTHGITFEAAAFTNLAIEHMDFHQTLEDYFAAKMMLFEQIKPNGTIVINADNEWGIKALEQLAGKNPVTSSLQNVTIANNNLDGLAVTLDGITLATTMLFGTFNAQNICQAYTLCKQLGVNTQTMQRALASFPGVPGRLQGHKLANGAYAFVDYAHNGSSFEAVLSTLRPLTKHLIVVFGCGGNRDKTRRTLLGQRAAEYADSIILTDDNPRFEKSEAIINDIVQAIPVEKRDRVVCEPNRHLALARAAAQATPESIIAILGKGHETSYIVEGTNYSFNDFKEIQQF